MPDLDFESSQLQLVTEALRAGPGTPHWREAIETLQQSPLTGAPDASPSSAAADDELKLLYDARERLASGREYKEVRAGAGFTRKVMDAIEAEGAEPSRRFLSAGVLAGISLVVLIAVVAAIIWLVVPHRGVEAPGGDDLSQTYFVTARSSANFESDLGMDWSAFGPLAVEARIGLRPVLKELDRNVFRGGGAMYQRTLAAKEPFAMDATIRVIKASDDLAVQVFVADDQNFSQESATSSHELVWSLRGSDASVVLPDGTVAMQAGKIQIGQSIDVRINVSGQQAAVEMGGKRLWSGRSTLDGVKPRVAGVRFLARGAAAQEDAPVVESVRILVPQQ